MEVRKRRKQTGISEPLLGEDSSASDSHASPNLQEQQSWAIVPLSVNRLDWAALWNGLSSACRTGWSSIVTTISNCLATVRVPSIQAIKVVDLSREQRQRLEDLQRRIKIRFDKEDTSHQEALKQLWGFAFPGEACTCLYANPRWTDMGWQQNDPSTDFRGAGFIALENLLYLAKNESGLFDSLLHKSNGVRSDWEYPFAVAGINLSFMLEALLDLRRKNGGLTLHTPANAAGIAFLHLLEDKAEAFDEVYCLAFEMLDRTWLEMGASYMEFSSVINRVKSQLQSALESRPRSMEGLSALLRP